MCRKSKLSDAYAINFVWPTWKVHFSIFYNIWFYWTKHLQFGEQAKCQKKRRSLQVVYKLLQNVAVENHRLTNRSINTIYKYMVYLSDLSPCYFWLFITSLQDRSMNTVLTRSRRHKPKPSSIWMPFRKINFEIVPNYGEKKVVIRWSKKK